MSSGSRSLHVQKKTCSNCGYPSASIRRCTSNLFLLANAAAVLTRRTASQLGREGQAEKDDGHRSHALAEAGATTCAQRVPHRYGQGGEGAGGEDGVEDGGDTAVVSAAWLQWSRPTNAPVVPNTFWSQSPANSSCIHAFTRTSRCPARVGGKMRHVVVFHPHVILW